MTTWRRKSDARASNASIVITGETYTIGEDDADYVYLNEVPLRTIPSSVVVKQGATTFVEVPGTPAASGQFRVFYSGRQAGALQFHPDDANKAITVDYRGTGSNLFARDINRLQDLKLDVDQAATIGGAGPTGTGSPEGVVAATVSTIYRQQDAPDGRALWIKARGIGTTGWIRQSNYVDVTALGTDATAFSNANTLVGNFGTIEIPPGTYDITSSITLSSHLTFMRGAVLRPAAGVTITIAGPIDAGIFQIFDVSASGNIVFAGPMRDVLPQWFGARNGQSFDSRMALEAAFASTPDGGRVTLTPDADFWVRGTIARRMTQDREIVGLRHKGGDAATPKIAWDGPYGARMFENDRTSYDTFQGIKIQLAPQADFEWTARAWGTAGSPIITIPAADGYFKFKPEWQGRQVVLLGMGADGSDLQATVLSYDSDTQITLDRNVVTTQGPTIIYIGSINGGFPALAGLDWHGLPTTGGGEGWGARTVAGSDVVEIWAAPSFGTPEDRGQITYAFPDWVGRTLTIQGAGTGGGAHASMITEWLSPLKVRIAAPAVTTTNNSWTLDGTGGGHIGTYNRCLSCQIFSPVPHPLMQAIRIGIDSQQNHEFYTIDGLNVQLNGYGQPALIGETCRVDVVAGSNVVTRVSGGVIRADHEGLRFLIEKAGPGGGTLDTVITRVVGNTITLRDNAVGAVSNAYTTLFGIGGYGIVISASPNSHGHILTNYQINGVRYAILNGGGYTSENGRCGSGVGTMHCLWGTARPCYLIGDIQEGVETFLDYYGTQLYVSQAAVGACWGRPNGALYRFWSGCVAEMKHCSFDESSPTTDRGGYTLADYSNTVGGASIRWIDPYWRGGTRTITEIGLNTAPFESASIEIIGGTPVIGDLVGGVMTANLSRNTHFQTGAYYNLSKDVNGPVVAAEKRGGTNATAVVYRAIYNGIDADPWRKEHYVRAGLDLPGLVTMYESIGQGGIDPSTITEAAGFRSRLLYSGSNSMPVYEHFVVETEENPGSVGNSGRALYGMRIKDLGPKWRENGPTRALWQEGALDTNLLAGRLFQAAPSTAPTESDFVVNSLSIQAEETQRVLKLHAKLSDGSRRTIELALDEDLRSYATAGFVDATTFIAADAAIGTNGALRLRPGTYDVDANVTISAHLIIERGAILRPTNGVTITIAGPVSIGDYTVFDLSLGGSVRFTGNGYIRKYIARWFGLVGDNTADDGPALNNLTNSIPDYCTVEFAPNLQMAVRTTWVISQRVGITFRSSSGWPHDSATGPAYATTQVRWDGAVGGTLISHLNNGYVTFESFVFDVGVAAVGIEMTEIASGRISTSCSYKNCTFLGGTEVGAICVRIGHDAPGNCELHTFQSCFFSGPLSINWNTLLLNGRAPAAGGFMVAGSNRIDGLTFDPSTTNVPGTTRQITVGMRARISLAGGVGTSSVQYGPGGQNGALDTTVTAIGSDFIDLAATAVSNVLVTWAAASVYARGDTVITGGSAYFCEADHTADATNQPGLGASWQTVWSVIVNTPEDVTRGPYMVFGQPVGYAVVIENQNSHRQQFKDCHIFNFLTGIYNNSGSHTAWTTNYGANDIDIYLVNNSMMCGDYDSNGENSLQHVVMSSGGGASFVMRGGRHGNGYAAPGKGFIENSNGVSLVVEGITFDNWVAYGSSLFDFHASSGMHQIHNIAPIGDGQSMSIRSLGLKDMGNATVVDVQAISPVPYDGGMAGRWRKVFGDRSGSVNTPLGEQLGPTYAILPALVGNNVPDPTTIDSGFFTFYATRERGLLLARRVNSFRETQDFELSPSWTTVTKSANYNVQDTDFGKIILVDTTAGDVTIGLPGIWLGFQVMILNIGTGGHTLQVSWAPGTDYNSVEIITTTTQGSGWSFRQYGAGNNYIATKMGV